MAPVESQYITSYQYFVLRLYGSESENGVQCLAVGSLLYTPRAFLHYAPCFGLALCIANPGRAELSAPA